MNHKRNIIAGWAILAAASFAAWQANSATVSFTDDTTIQRVGSSNRSYIKLLDGGQRNGLDWAVISYKNGLNEKGRGSTYVIANMDFQFMGGQHVTTTRTRITTTTNKAFIFFYKDVPDYWSAAFHGTTGCVTRGSKIAKEGKIATFRIGCPYDVAVIEPPVVPPSPPAPIPLPAGGLLLAGALLALRKVRTTHKGHTPCAY